MPSGYNLFLTRQAKKELTKIKKGNPKDAKAISDALSQLMNNPYLGEFLHGDLNGRRKLRVKDYRIVYNPEKDRLILYIFRIAHRKEVYR